MGAAAEVASSRRTGAAALGRTKHLFVTLTLLSLLCPAASFIDKDQLEDIMKNIHKLQGEAERKMAENLLDSAFISELVEEVTNMMDPAIKLVEKALTDFPPLVKLLKDLKVFMESSRDYIKKQHQKEAAKLRDNVGKLKELEELMMKKSKADL